MPADNTSEVKWQVAMWALVPLALGAMTQSCGRVFDYSGSLAFWLRSSPFICVGDVLSFAFSILIDYTVAPTFSLKHVRSELAWRFQDTDFKTKTVTEAGRSIITRWMLIILGGIPFQTIKIFAMQGIPFTQLLAMAFFFPQIIGEILHLSAIIIFTPGGIPDVSTLDIPSKKSQYTAVAATLRWIYNIMQACVFCVIVCDLGHRAVIRSKLVRYTFTFNDPKDSLFLSGLSLVIPIITFSNLRLTPSLRLRSDMPGFSFAYYVCCVGNCMAMCFSLAMEEHLQVVYERNTDPESRFSMYPLVIALLASSIGVCVTVPIASVIFLAIYYGIESCSQKFAATRVGQVLGMPGEKLERDLLNTCLLNFVVLVLGYCYHYSSKGTYNPSWIGVFG